jgi:hypothetical protein
MILKLWSWEIRQLDFLYIFGGKTPVNFQNSRAVLCNSLFNCKAETVARPQDVLPVISVLFLHRCPRGLKIFARFARSESKP